MNHCLFSLLFRLGRGSLASGRELNYWTDLHGYCSAPGCRKYIPAGTGVVCANYLVKRGSFPKCKGAWCAGCYKDTSGLFRVREVVDDDGMLLKRKLTKLEKDRFLVARSGDHLVCTFQCEVCHYRNMNLADPRLDRTADREALVAIRRAIMDGFWNIEPSTVRSTRNLLARAEETGLKWGIKHMTPHLGPFPLEDVQGMKAALAVLDKSQDRGKYEDHVQPSTYRKMQSAFTKIHQASVGGVAEQIAAYKSNKLWVSKSPTHTLWFSQFMSGIKARTGQVVKQDKAVSIEVLHAVLKLLEERWSRAEEIGEKERVSRMGAWYAGGFCGALRGEEHLIVELAGTANSLVNLTQRGKQKPYLCLRVTGKTKACRDAGHTFPVPMAGRTQGTQIDAGKWVSRLVKTLHQQGRRNGYLFSVDNGMKARLGDFEDDFYELLETVQDQQPELIPPEVDVREEYGIWRSLRRGVTAHALNQGVPRPLINSINRWRNEREGSGSATCMIDVYTELEGLIPYLLRYSSAL